MGDGPVFVVGAARSGTTLLRLMIDCHPEFAIPPESHFVVTLAARRLRLREHSSAALEAALAHHRFALWKLDPGEARAHVVASRPVTYADVMRGLFEAYASHRGARRWGDKTPGYVESLPLLDEFFPDARFIHVIRDGRAVAASVAEKPWGPPTPVSAAWWWRGRVQKGRHDGARLGPKRYLEIRYEDLVAQPRESLTSVCEFLDEDFDEAMFDYPGVAADRLPPGTVESGALHERTLLPPSRMDDRFGALESDVRASVEYVCRPLLRELGYEVRERSSLGAAVGAYARWFSAIPARAAQLVSSTRNQRRRLV